MRLVTKFSISATLLVLLIAVTISVVLYIFLNQLTIEQMEQSQKTMLKGLTEVSKESLLLNNDVLLINFLKQLEKSKDVAFGMVVDPKGEIISHNNPKYLGKFINDKAGYRALACSKFTSWEYIDKQGRVIYELCEPVIQGNKTRAIVRIGFYRKEIDSMIGNAVTVMGRRLLNITFIAIVLGLIGAILLAIRLSTPIKEIAEGAKLIGDGKLNHRIDVKTHDEIGWLAEEFNMMAMKLQELDQLKDDFVSSVTHELRSPLTAITGYVDYLLSENKTFSPEELEYLQIIKKNANRLGKFVNDILDMAKIESGQMDIEFTEVNLTQLFEEILTLFKPLAEQKNITVKSELEPGIPTIRTDYGKLTQVLTNLISNSLKFTPENGQITVSAGRTPEKGFVEVTVSDSGVGIKKDDISKIFDKFYQVKSTREKVVGMKGTGLGLTIVRGLVDALGGRIWVESETNRGTAFHFTQQVYEKEA